MANTFTDLNDTPELADTPQKRWWILKPSGFQLFHSIASQYENKFPQQLSDRLDEYEFTSAIDSLNYKIARYWPCGLSYYCGFIFCPCTLGLSLFVPGTCISDAEQALRQQIYTVNQKLFNKYGLQIELVKRWGCRSYLKITERQ